MRRHKKLFVHGWVADKRAFNGVMEDGDVSIDLPSHGKSPALWDKPTIEPALKELYKHRCADFIGVGWSLGGIVLLQALANGMELKALILIGSTPSFIQRKGFPHGQKRALVRRMILDVKKDPLNTLKRFYRLNFTEKELDMRTTMDFLKLYENPRVRTDGLVNALTSLMSVDLRTKLKHISTPTLIIHGGRDNVTPVEAGMYLKKNIKHARLKVFEDSGHAPFVTEPVEFNKIIGEFIDRL